MNFAHFLSVPRRGAAKATSRPPAGLSATASTMPPAPASKARNALQRLAAPLSFARLALLGWKKPKSATSGQPAARTPITRKPGASTAGAPSAPRPAARPPAPATPVDDDDELRAGSADIQAARQRERSRIEAIMTAPAAARAPELAQGIALQTRLTLSEAVALLEAQTAAEPLPAPAPSRRPAPPRPDPATGLANLMAGKPFAG